MAKKVIITSDSTFDFTPELIQEYQVKVCPLSIILDDKSYRDGVDITADDIFEIYRKTKKLPKTAAVNPSTYREFFTSFTKQGYSVVHVSLSSCISTTYNNAVIAASELQDVYVVDSKNLILYACEMRDQGIEAADIAKELIRFVPYCKVSFVLDSLEFLHKGGRCSGVAALGANLLKLKPCIMVTNDGKMVVGKKYRGKLENVLEQYTRDTFIHPETICMDRIFITHSGISNEIIERVKKTIHQCCDVKKIFVTRAGCTISSHCGPNTLGIIYVKKQD